MSDWRTPIPKFDLRVVHPDTGEVLLDRPAEDAGKPIPPSVYRRLEAERRRWAEATMATEALEAANRKAEIDELRARQMVRDSLEETADTVFKLLSEWPKYVDTERWVELLAWLRAHPPRISQQDEQLMALDSRLEQLQGFPISPIQLKRGRGREKGSRQSPASNAKRSIAMSKRWQEWNREGTAPAVGRPPKQRLENDEAPY